MAVLANGFVPASLPQLQRMQRTRDPSTSVIHMSDSNADFGSAMPTKPELSMEERLVESATEFISMFTARLGEGVPEPPEVAALKEARDTGAGTNVMAARIYELMIEQGMLYDEDPDNGTLTPTDFDIKSSLEDPVIKKEFDFLYKYGMGLFSKGLVDVETIKTIVKERLIARTGLTPEKFDEWLGY